MSVKLWVFTNRKIVALTDLDSIIIGKVYELLNTYEIIGDNGESLGEFRGAGRSVRGGNGDLLHIQLHEDEYK